MKVLLQSRVDLFDKPGGDLVQMQQTQQALQQLGVEVDISTELSPDLAGYDLVHLFNITRIHDTYTQLLNAKRQGKKVVLSPIHHRRKEIERYERFGRTGALRMANVFLRSIPQREYVKSVARLRDVRQRQAIAMMWQKGFYEAQQHVLEEADRWIVLAQAEARAIVEDFGVSRAWSVAYNAVDPRFLAVETTDPAVDLPAEFVLSVGRIEDRKNQLRLIEAMDGLGIELVLVGGKNPHHKGYWRKLERAMASRPWVHYIGSVDYMVLPNVYAKAKVHVLPSWFEVVSLTALEAAATGCNGVVSDTGYIREYVGDSVAYCDPGSVESIRRAVLEAVRHPKDYVARGKVKNLTWEHTAKQTIAAYEETLRHT